MARDWLGKPRVDCAVETLQRFKPEVEVEPVNANLSEANANELIAKADIVFDAAPLFEERFAMNRACVALNRPLIDCAMYSMEGQVIPIFPGRTPCLACIYPAPPTHWKRRFPVLGAVSAIVAQIGALEGIKHIAGFGEVAAGKMLTIDTATMRLDTITLAPRREDCPVCAPEPTNP